MSALKGEKHSDINIKTNKFQGIVQASQKNGS